LGGLPATLWLANFPRRYATHFQPATIYVEEPLLTI